MCQDLATGLHYLHKSALVTLAGFDERDINVFSLVSADRSIGARLRISLARACRHYDYAPQPRRTLHENMQEDVRSLGQAMASVVHTLQLGRRYNGPRFGPDPAGIETLQVDGHAIHVNLAALILACVRPLAWQRPEIAQVRVYGRGLCLRQQGMGATGCS